MDDVWDEDEWDEEVVEEEEECTDIYEEYVPSSNVDPRGCNNGP